MDWRTILLPQALAATLAVAIAMFVSLPSSASIEVKHLKRWSSWTKGKDPSGYLIDLDQGPQTQNQPSAKIQSNLPVQKGDFASIFQDFSPNLYRGKRVEYTGFIKTEKLNGTSSLWMTVEDENNVLEFDDMEGRSPKGTKAWHKYSIVLDVPQSSKRLRVGFIMKGGGAAWLRDPVVKIVDAKFKPTDRPFDPIKFPLNKLRSEPRNLEFEAQKQLARNRNDSIHNWAVSTDSGFQLNLDEDVLLGGKPSVRIYSSNPASPGFGSLYQVFSAQDYCGKRIEWSGSVKTSNVTDWAGLFMQVSTKDRVVAFDAMEERPVKGTNDWTKCRIVLDVPPDSKKIKIGFLTAGSGRSWISNCAFKVVNKDVPVTGKSVMDDRIPPEKLEQQPFMGFD